MKDFCKICNRYAPVVGRTLMGGLFVLAAYSKLTASPDGIVSSLQGFAAFLTSIDIPAALAVSVVIVAVEILAGVALIVGYRAYYAATALAVFTLLTIIVVHRDLADVSFTKNFAIVGGLLYVLAFGAGPISLDDKLRKDRLSKEGQTF